MKYKYQFLFLFLAVTIVELISEQIGSRLLYLISKPLLMPMLILFLIQNNSIISRKIMLLTLIALLFSWLGDVFLMFSPEIYFLLGLASFLMAHLIYIFIFSIDFKWRGWVAILFLFILLIYGSFLLNYIWLGLENMTLPVLFYTATILTMVFTAFNRKKLRPGFYRLILLGAISFVVSDSLIALDKFTEVNIGRYFIMATYCLAQFLIVFGLAKSNQIVD